MTHKWIVKGASGSRVESEDFVRGFFGDDIADVMIHDAHASDSRRTIKRVGGFWQVECAIIGESFFDKVMSMNANALNDRMEWEG